jgi:hypothetical protein
MHFTSNFTSQLVAPASARFEVIEAVISFIIGITVCLLMIRQSCKMMLLDAEPAH